MGSLKVFVLFGVVFGPSVIQGQDCPRTSREANTYCASECVPSLTCSSNDEECICDGDCGYSCIKKDLRCRKPRYLENGQRRINSRKFNGTANFTCDAGYTLSGSSVRRCRSGAVWDGVEPKCGKKCNAPVINNNTLIRGGPIRNSGYMTSDKIHYYCAAGHVIEGKNVATCQSDGTWDNSPPQCYRVSCQPPKFPANSKLLRENSFNLSQGARDGKIILLSCKPGYYKVVSFPRMTCSAGQWQLLPTSFECLPKSCGDPGTPRNGGKIGLTYHFKDRMEFYCDKCYKLVGDSYRDCNADQSWSGQQPTCQKVDLKCKLISSIPNGWVSVISTGCGEKAEFLCDKYYNLVGNSKIICNDNGTWSASPPRCEPFTCPKLNTSRTILANISGYEPGSTARFSCNDSKFILSDDTVISCRKNGEWSAGVPECLAFTCPKLNTSGTILANISGYEPGSTARFSCSDSNFILSDDTVISCRKNYEWSAGVPECLAPCYVNATENLISKKVYQHGSKADLKCDDGFQLTGLIGSEMLICSNGKWNFGGGSSGSRKYPYCTKNEDAENIIQDLFSKAKQLSRKLLENLLKKTIKN